MRSLSTTAGSEAAIVDDMALAVTEVLTNALIHGQPPALLHIYEEGTTWVTCMTPGGTLPNVSLLQEDFFLRTTTFQVCVTVPAELVAVRTTE